MLIIIAAIPCSRANDCPFFFLLRLVCRADSTARNRQRERVTVRNLLPRGKQRAFLASDYLYVILWEWKGGNREPRGSTVEEKESIKVDNLCANPCSECSLFIRMTHFPPKDCSFV